MASWKNHFSITSRDFRDHYEKKTGEYIPMKQYRPFIDDLFHTMFDMMFTEKFHITFPNGIGDIYLKESNPPGNNAHTMDLSGTYGKYFKVFYDKKYAFFRTKKYYGFKLNNWAKNRKNSFIRKMIEGKMRVPDTFGRPLPKYIDLNE